MTVSVHCMVKNDDFWIWFAIQSVLPHVDRVVVYDTGSTDDTVKIIKSINSSKIYLTEIVCNTPKDITNCRQKMLDEEKADWILFLDGDEIWPEKAIRDSYNQIISDPKLDYLVSCYKNLIGDVYHYQEERAGKYKINSYHGHVTIRWINRKKLYPLHFHSDYPLEELRTSKNISLQNDSNLEVKYISYPYLHATHLKRSSLNTSSTQNRKFKKKYELGISQPNVFVYPSCFYFVSPVMVGNPWEKRNLWFLINALWQTPLKLIKRSIKV